MLFISSSRFEILKSVLSLQPEGISCRSYQLNRNSLKVCLSGADLISPKVLKDSFVGYRILGWQFFSFSTLNISLHCHMASKVVYKKLAINFIEILCTCKFLLSYCFQNSLCLWILMTLCLSVRFLFFFLVYLPWTGVCWTSLLCRLRFLVSLNHWWALSGIFFFFQLLHYLSNVESFKNNFSLLIVSTGKMSFSYFPLSFSYLYMISFNYLRYSSWFKSLFFW